MKNIALCQDCLRVHRLCDLVPDDNFPGTGLCPACGGSACNCAFCIAGIDALAQGDWEHAGLQDHVRPVSWSPDSGLVQAPAATQMGLR